MATFCWGLPLVHYIYRNLLFTSYLFFSHRHLIILACYLDLHLYSCPRWLSTRVLFSVLRPLGFAVSPRFPLFVRTRDLQSPRAFSFLLFERPQRLQSLRASLLSVSRGLQFLCAFSPFVPPGGLHSLSVCFIGSFRVSCLPPKANL